MVPFGVKFDLTQEPVPESDYDWLPDLYAQYFGHEPSGHWILVVNSDNDSDLFRFDEAGEMWCCTPEREGRLEQLRSAHAVRRPPFEDPPWVKRRAAAAQPPQSR